VADCDYYLGNGNRAEKHLWAGNVDAQIKEMKSLWNGFPKDAKPDWLSMNDILDYEQKMKNKYADGGFMNNVYAKGGSVKKDWWHTVVNPNEDFNNFDDKMPIDWDVDDFKSWVVSNSDLDGNADKEVLDVVKIPKSKLTVEYLNKNGSGENNNEFYKKYGNWQSALYDIFTQMKKDYLFKKSLKYILKADIKTVTVKTKNGKEAWTHAHVRV
jgi:hypothetical protein